MTGSTHSGEPGISLAITIDTECDKGPGWRVRQPLGFRNVLEGVPGRLQPIFERWGVKPTYLLSPEVLLHDGCVGLFRGLNDRVELGTHLHSEFVGPGADPATTGRGRLQRRGVARGRPTVGHSRAWSSFKADPH